jgi:hypothetical protein
MALSSAGLAEDARFGKLHWPLPRVIPFFVPKQLHADLGFVIFVLSELSALGRKRTPATAGAYWPGLKFGPKIPSHSPSQQQS